MPLLTRSFIPNFVFGARSLISRVDFGPPLWDARWHGASIRKAICALTQHGHLAGHPPSSKAIPYIEYAYLAQEDKHDALSPFIALNSAFDV